MQRKKLSTGANNTAAVLELDENEDLVEEVTTTKRVGRQRRESAPGAAAPLPIIDIEPDDDDDDREETPEFSDTSLAALIYSGGEERVENQYCTIAIRRNPDSMNDRFLTPCGSNTNLPPLRNVELTADRMDIEERVRAEFGGGHYFFQIHFDNRLRSSWKATLSDDPIAVQAARIAKDTPTHATPVAAPAAAANPIDAFLDNLEKQKRMQELLFGDQRERYERELADLRAEVAAAKREPSEPKGERLIMLEQALATPNADLQGRLLNHIFPSDEEGSRHWSADLLAVALDNKEVLLGLAGSLLGPLLGGGQPQPSFADQMRAPVASTPAITPPDPNRFRRPRIETPEPPPTDTVGTPWPPPADESAEVGASVPFVGGEPLADPPSAVYSDTSDAEGPDVPIEAFFDQPEPLPLTSEGIDQTTDADADDADEVPEAVQAVKKRRGAAK